jgi:HAD superfamily hydrolase (TIGR01549 family)
MIKAILFDLWNTLVHNRPNNPLDQFAEKIGKSMDDYSYVKIFEKHLMMDEYHDIEARIRDILNELGIGVDESRVKELGEILTEIIPEKIKAYPETFETLKSLKGRFKLGLVSNSYYPKVFDLLDSKFDLRRIFDYIALSNKVNLLKPDPRIFTLTLEKLNVKPEEALMVGDSLKDDVEAAEKLGIKGVLFDIETKHPEYPRRIKSMDELHEYLGK